MSAKRDGPVEARLYQLIELDERGVGEVRNLASLRAGLVNAPDAALVVKKLEALGPSDVRTGLKQMLDINPVAVLVKGWVQLRKIRDAIRRSLEEPGVEQEVNLPAHTFEAKLKPRLVLTVHEVDWLHVDFEVGFSGKVTSGRLSFMGGALSVVHLAPVKATLAISCEGASLGEMSRPFQLLGDYRFSPALALLIPGTVRPPGAHGPS